jgi:hypothetical protein
MKMLVVSLLSSLQPTWTYTNLQFLLSIGPRLNTQASRLLAAHGHRNMVHYRILSFKLKPIVGSSCPDKEHLTLHVRQVGKESGHVL